MRVKLLEGTPDPEELVCRCARGDYSDEWVGKSRSFEDVMGAVKGDTIEEKKETLLDHLMRSGHWGPFEHPTATFAVEGISRACMAQLTRHRHASFDVMSLRYVDLSSGMDLKQRFTYPNTFQQEEVVSREGVDNVKMSVEERRDLVDRIYEECASAYCRLIEAGVPKEDARMLLPIGTKVNLTFSMNSRSLMHLLDMRMKADSQWEIRELSRLLLAEAKQWMPQTFVYYEKKHPFKLTP
jgi:thymidylate synthase (FAD)